MGVDRIKESKSTSGGERLLGNLLRLQVAIYRYIRADF